jgi:hypothetical protein
MHTQFETSRNPSLGLVPKSHHNSTARHGLLLAAVFTAVLAACGGGVDTDPAAADQSELVEANKQLRLAAPLPTTTCTDPTPSVTSTVKFVAPTGAGTGVVLSGNGTSVCFDGSTAVGVRATVAVQQGAGSFYYFEAQRSTPYNVAIGVSGSPTQVPAGGGTDFLPSSDTLYVQGGNTLAGTASGGYSYGTIGLPSTVGFAVDYRAKYPVVSVIGPASGNPGACPGIAATDLCVLSRKQLEGVTGQLYIHAWGVGEGTVGTGPRISINTGSKLTTKPFAFGMPEVQAALRASWFAGDRGLNAQWPGPSGAATPVVVALAGHERVVIRQGDTTPYRTSLKLKVTGGSSTPTYRWIDETGVVRGTASSLTVNTALVNAMGPGAHRITARVTAPTTGRYGEATYQFTVLSSVADTDDDGDGLTYSQEDALGTDPGNPDTDADGLSDGAEAAYALNPRKADTDGNGVLDGYQLAGTTNLVPRVMLAAETGTFATSTGVIVSNDGYQAAFTEDINQDCLQAKAPFTDPAYQNPDTCYKRAVRANAGVRKGEFRYFETRRLGGPENLGHGLIARNAQIDPYCCFNSLVMPTPPEPITPPSMGLNSIGGVFVQLVLAPQWQYYPDYNRDQTAVQGFAVDYRGADPVVYVVLTDSLGAMTISEGLTLFGFANGEAVPMLYGHPNLNNEARSAVNMGLQKFHYDPAAIRAVLASRGVATTAFVPGVGIHRWK